VHSFPVLYYRFLCRVFPLPFFLYRLQRGKIPVQVRFRSDNYAAILRLQNTQPKDRRIYTTFTGILAALQPVQKKREREDRAEETIIQHRETMNGNISTINNFSTNTELQKYNRIII